MIRPASRQALILLVLWIPLAAPLAAEVKRVVIIKLDGVPEHVLERELSRVDPVTHKSTLPWIDRVFAQGGAMLDNFYVRGISLPRPLGRCSIPASISRFTAMPSSIVTPATSTIT